jgi:chromosome partitioning protein
MIIAVACQKGGVGKTSTTISLSSGLARKGKKVLLIDMDFQANSSKVLVSGYPQLTKDQTVYATILERKPLPIHSTHLPTLSIVPSHILLSETDVDLTTAIDHREARLKNELDKIKDQYDFIFLDNPPALGWLTINSFTAADKALVVVSPGYFELDSIVQISKTIANVKEFFNPHLQMLGFLFNLSDNTINTRTSLQLLRQTYTDAVLHTIIPRSVDIKDASMNHTDIFGYNPESNAAKAYARLLEEVFLHEQEAA